MADATSPVPRRLGPAIGVLLSAFDYAQDIGVCRWQFAVDVSELLATGAAIADLRWLVLKRFAEPAREVTVPGDRERVFRELPASAFQVDNCLALSSDGATALRVFVDSADFGPHSGRAVSPLRPVPRSSESDPLPEGVSDDTTAQIKPTWDPVLHELRLGNDVVKRFAKPASAQEAILNSFQEDGWPAAIDDPLPPQASQDPKRRLHYTVRNLNRGQDPQRIRFYINGNGETIRWALVPNTCAPAARSRRAISRRQRKSPRQ